MLAFKSSLLLLLHLNRTQQELNLRSPFEPTILTLHMSAFSVSDMLTMHSDYPPSFPPFPHFPFPISPLSSLQVPYVGSFWFGLRPSAFRHFLLFSWVRSPPLEPGGLTDGCLTDAVDLSITLNCEYCELELYPLSYIARVSPPAIFLANGSLKTDFHLCHPECPQTHGLQ